MLGRTTLRELLCRGILYYFNCHTLCLAGMGKIPLEICLPMKFRQEFYQGTLREHADELKFSPIPVIY